MILMMRMQFMDNVNKVAFCKEDVEKGLHLDFIKQLVDFNYKTACNFYYDIHITFDGFTTTVEWCENGLEDYIGKFEYVDSDHEVMLVGYLPDGTFDYFSSNTDYDKSLCDFLNKNPWYYKDSFGNWQDSRENNCK